MSYLPATQCTVINLIASIMTRDEEKLRKLTSPDIVLSSKDASRPSKVVLRYYS